MFTDKDYAQMNTMGIHPDLVKKQVGFFKNGFPFINLDRAATPGDGIVVLNKNEIEKLVSTYEKESKSEQIVKFVPASGAASRMFKDLYAFVEEWNGNENDENQKKYKNVFKIFSQVQEFAFVADLKEILKKDFSIDLNNFVIKNDYKNILNSILNEKGLNYGNLPKALIKFHSYATDSRTSLEEHLVEGALYAVTSDRYVYIHFTVTPEHLKLFENKLQSVLSKYEDRFQIKFKISYSIQKPSTDTIAVTIDNKPFRTNEGKLLFRPGGHGALIENLNELNVSIVFIKNIDNVVPDYLKLQTVLYKKAIGGLLLKLRKNIFSFLYKIEKGENSNELKNEILEFYKKYFHLSIEPEISLENLFKMLNRPIRVCGMVKNEGEPGGGPYWIKANNTISLQIIESSQINSADDNQLNIFKQATHFNPVDLVCSMKDYKGNKFDLNCFIDPNTGFISKKSKDGIELKALELPGLWNGAMSDWNTIFVEVPIITFNPVKTINDLLRSEHQSSKS
jgi:hypothetical protein